MRSCFSLAALCIAGLLFTVSASGQASGTDAKPTPRQISGGVLNGKAMYLPKPNYPPAAKAVGAAGAVSVQVLIDEEGYIASATAVSGHPLLREAAIEAAHSARFSPTTLNGQPVKVSGVIVYNFVRDISLTGLGYELALAERSGRFRKYVAAQLPANWAAERQVLSTLSYDSDRDSVKTAKTAKGAYLIQGEGLDVTAKLTPESVRAIGRLQTDIDARLRADQNRQWAFRLGQALGKLVGEINDENRMRLNTVELEQLTATAPANAPEQAMNKLRSFIDKAKSAGSSPTERKSLVSEAEMLRNLLF